MSDYLQQVTQVNVFSELLFWSGFLFFNFTLFAFNYIINIKETDFLPVKKLFVQGGFFISANADFFRFSIDMSIFILLFRFNFITSGMVLVAFYYGFLLVFNTYHYSFNKIYQVNPIFLNDLKLLKNGAGILWDESKLKLIIGISSLILITLILTILMKYYLLYVSTLDPKFSTYIISSLILIVFAIALIRKGYGHKTEIFHRYLIHLLRLGRHGLESYKLIKKRKLLNLNALEQHRKVNLKLGITPNIYLIFIESYGSILLRHSKLAKDFTQKINEFHHKLKILNWGCKVNYSSSVSLIGPSWMAYTSVLLGTRVDSNFYYEYLLNEKRIYKYDTLIKVFQNQGYQSINLNATKFKKGVNVPLKQMKNFYGFDQFILSQDIPYKGAKYGFTENPPDQYVINYTYEHYLKNSPRPFVLFYLTKNSHSPFYTPEFSKNWQDLNNTADQLVGHNFLQQPTLKDYIKAIDYQLQFLLDFILNKGRGNDIFLLIGDHQPHVLANMADGTETIVHVISQDDKFLSEFDQYGFQDSIEGLDSPVKHEAMYSIFLRSFIKTYSMANQEIPDYEPNGLQF